MNEMSRRNFLAATAVTSGVVLGTAAPAVAKGRRPRPNAAETLVGAIRWDAWNGSDTLEGSTVNRTLSPEEYHFRLPYFAEITVAQRTLISQNFDGEPVGAAPAGWSVSAPAETGVSVVQVPGREGKSVLLHGASGSASAEMSRTFASQERAVTVKWQWKETQAGAGARASLRHGSTAVLDIATREVSGAKELVHRGADGSWKPIQTIADDTWYSLKVIADPAPPAGAAPWIDIYVDGVRKVKHVPFPTPTVALDGLAFQTDAAAPADLFVDGVSVEITESVNSVGDTQAIMDEEIQYAKRAGIDYWAFCYYKKQPLYTARELYHSSAYKGDINWCAVIDPNIDGGFDEHLPDLIEDFGDSGYQKVLDGRPLIYILDNAVIPPENVTKMRDAAAAAGVGNPYIVMMSFSAQHAADLMNQAGADAVSSYRYSPQGKTGIPYSEVIDIESGLWSDYAAAGGTTVPFVTTGVDKRPRYDYVTPWEPNYEVFKNLWFQQATPEEIATHLSGAVQWCRAHPENAPANTVLIYAWNEFDEGGWICPTRDEIRETGRPLRLEAIAKVPRI